MGWRGKTLDDQIVLTIMEAGHPMTPTQVRNAIGVHWYLFATPETEARVPDYQVVLKHLSDMTEGPRLGRLKDKPSIENRREWGARRNSSAFFYVPSVGEILARRREIQADFLPSPVLLEEVAHAASAIGCSLTLSKMEMDTRCQFAAVHVKLELPRGALEETVSLRRSHDNNDERWAFLFISWGLM